MRVFAGPLALRNRRCECPALFLQCGDGLVEAVFRFRPASLCCQHHPVELPCRGREVFEAVIPDVFIDFCQRFTSSGHFAELQVGADQVDQVGGDGPPEPGFLVQLDRLRVVLDGSGRVVPYRLKGAEGIQTAALDIQQPCFPGGFRGFAVDRFGFRCPACLGQHVRGIESRVCDVKTAVDSLCDLQLLGECVERSVGIPE